MGTGLGSVPTVATGLLVFGIATTGFQEWIIALVEGRTHRRNREGVALVNLIFMPAGQALLLTFFFQAVGAGPRPALPSAIVAGVPRLVPLWGSALVGFFVGLLLTVLPFAGRYLREPEISIFCAGFFTGGAYQSSGFLAGLWAVWAFGRDHPWMSIGLLALAKGISLTCRYGIALCMRSRQDNRHGPRPTSRFLLSLAVGTSSMFMLVPVLTLLKLLAG